MKTTPYAVEIRNLTKQFGSLTAVDDLSLTIKPGEIYGFLGLNGAGKTTTIRMMLGMIKPTSGSVSLFGTMIQPGHGDIWSKVGYMVETPNSYPELTVRENLEIQRRLQGLKEKKSVDNVIERLRLNRETEKPAGKLSLGNRQRLGLARAFIHNPSLLLLDEPANGLDPAGIVEIRHLLKSLAEEEGVTIFMSSHILAEVARLATRIGVINNGRLVKELDPKDLDTQEQAHLAVSVGNIPAALSVLEQAGIPAAPDEQDRIIISDPETVRHPEKIATLLVRADCPPGQLVTEHEDLEEYFLELVGK